MMIIAKTGIKLSKTAPGTSKKERIRRGNNIIKHKKGNLVFAFNDWYCFSSQQGQDISGYNVIVFLIVCFQLHLLLQFLQVGITIPLSFTFWPVCIIVE